MLTQGYCKFCGQVIELDKAVENEVDAIVAAIRLCDCDDAYRYTRIEKAQNAATGSLVGLSENIQTLVKEAISLVGYELIENITVKINYELTLKIYKNNSTGRIKMDFKRSEKQQLEL